MWTHELQKNQIQGKVFIKYCVFFLKCFRFFISAISEGDQSAISRSGVQYILEFLNTIFDEHPVHIRTFHHTPNKIIWIFLAYLSAL